MKNIFTLCIALILGLTINAQPVTFCDDFEGYQNGDPIAQTSSDWETWGSIVEGMYQIKFEGNDWNEIRKLIKE